MRNLPGQLMKTVVDTIQQYGLVDVSRPLLVALSGGKDSLLLCLALREIGIAYRAVTIDMGYEDGWADRIRLRAGMVGVEPEVVSARETTTTIDAAPVRRRLDVLDAISTTTKPAVTPCTYCYSVKVLLFEAVAARTGASQVAFAHHMTDAAASLLKEALLHVDRFDRGHTRYERANFESLVMELADVATNYETDQEQPLLQTINALVTTAQVGTDEPPRQPLRHDRPDGVEIVRPLFRVDEDTIVREVARNEIQTEGSGCGHGMTLSSQTPREMVHHRVLAGRGDTDFFAHTRKLVCDGVDQNGSGITMARSRRQHLLGCQYKPVVAEFDKL